MPSSPPASASPEGTATTRRRLLQTLGAGAVTSLAGCVSRPPPLSLSRWWRQYGYDAANTAYNPDAEGPPADPEPVVQWTHRAGAYHHGNQPLSMPGGTVVDTGYEGVFVLDGGGNVVWHDDEDYHGLAPAVPDSLVLATSYGFRGVGRDGGISLLGHRLAFEHWRTHSTYPESPPTVADDLVVAGIGVTGHSPGDGRVAAFDVRSGERRWRAPVETVAKGAPAVAGDLVFAADLGGTVDFGDPQLHRYVYAFDRGTGAERWRTRITGDPWASVNDALVVGDGLVHVPAGPGSLYTLDAETGDVRWRRDVGIVQASPALADGTLYVATREDGLFALDAATGDTIWQRPFEMAFAGPVVVGDRVYLVGAEGHLAGFDRDGTLAWDRILTGGFTTPPVVDHMTVYVGSEQGALYAVGEPS